MTLAIRNVGKSFGDNRALDGIDMVLEPGLFGLLGPNGAGKSTLMRSLATLLKPDTGTITLDGTDIVERPTYMRARLGYLPQDFGVYPRMSALKLLDHLAVLKGLTNKAERKEQIEALLHAVNLWTHRTASVATYSGGMRQRFGVAQAMLGDPKVLIVDEPTAGLDPFERQRFLDLLSEAGEEKIIILSTHIVEDVRDLCTDMAIMGGGKLVARGGPEDLIDTIRGEVWRTTVEKDVVDGLKSTLNVLSTRLSMGKVIVSALSPASPGAGWAGADPVLEDAYFAYLNSFKTPATAKAAA